MSKKKGTKISLDFDFASAALPTSSNEIHESKSNRYVAPKNTNRQDSGFSNESSQYSDRPPRSERPPRQEYQHTSEPGFSRSAFGSAEPTSRPAKSEFIRDRDSSESRYHAPKSEPAFSRDAFGSAEVPSQQDRSDSGFSRSNRSEGGFGRYGSRSDRPEDSSSRDNFSRDAFGTADNTSKPQRSQNWSDRSSTRSDSNETSFSRSNFGTADNTKTAQDSTNDRKFSSKQTKPIKQTTNSGQPSKTLQSLGKASQFSLLEDLEEAAVSSEPASNKEEEEAKRKAEEAAAAARKAEEEVRKAAEEAKHKAAEEARKVAEEAKRAEEEEAKRKAAAEEETKRAAEEEAKRIAEEEEAKRKALYPDIPESKQGAFYQALFVDHSSVSFGQIKKSLNDYFPLHPATKKALGPSLAQSIHEAFFNVRYLITNLSKLFVTGSVAAAKKAGEANLDEIRSQSIIDCYEIIASSLVSYQTIYGEDKLVDLIKSENDDNLLNDLKPANADLNTWLQSIGLSALIHSNSMSNDKASTYEDAISKGKSSTSIDQLVKSLLAAASFKDSKTAIEDLSPVLLSVIGSNVQEFLVQLFDSWGQHYSENVQLIKTLAADLVKDQIITFQDLAVWRDTKETANAFKANALLAVGYWINVNAPAEAKVVEHEYGDE